MPLLGTDARCQALACKVPALVRHAGKGDFQAVPGPSAVKYDILDEALFLVQDLHFETLRLFPIQFASVNDCETLHSKVEELLKRGEDTEWSRRRNCVGRGMLIADMSWNIF